MTQTDEPSVTLETARTRLGRYVGTAAWALWGVLHIAVGTAQVFAVVAGRPEQVLLLNGAREPVSSLHPVAAALLANHGFNLAWGGLFALVVALLLNRVGSRAGYFANLTVISGFDAAFILFMVAPGHMPLQVAVLGPALWLIGAVTLALDLRNPSRSVVQS